MPCRTSFRPAPRLPRALFILLALLSSLAFAGRVEAQLDEDGPTVTISPADVALVSPLVSVTVTWYDDTSLKFSTAEIRLNDTTVVTPFFTHGSVTRVGGTRMVQAQSTGTIQLLPGPNRITATIRDSTGKAPLQMGDVVVTYRPGRSDVAVSPNGGHTQLPSGGTRSLAFRVRNTGTAADTFLLSPRCRDGWSGAAVGCSVSPASVVVAPGDSARGVVSFPGGGADGVTFVSLSATRKSAPGVTDTGWMDVTFTWAAGNPPVPLGLRLVDLNSTGTIARDQCVAVGVAPGAAMECGDLRLAHALPAVQVMGKAKAPVLLYNSAHLTPTARLYADVTVPSGAAVPTTVELHVVRSDGSRESTTRNGAHWVAGGTRRVAMMVPWPDLTPTGLYDYTLEVVAVYADGTRLTSSILDGEVAIVNRSRSEFGPGWWLAGYERLHFVSKGRILWVGGDGSTRVYSPTTTGTWVAATVSRPDTLFPTTYPAATYERRLRGGGRVAFYAAGNHAGTETRLRQHTQFAGDGDAGRLAWVSIGWQRTYGGQELKYYFHQDPATRKIVAITAPDLYDNPGRTVTLARNSIYQTDSIIDPDGGVVKFGYSGRNIVSRTDRRGVQSTFTYGGGQTLASSRMVLESGEAIVNTFAPVEAKGFNAPPPLAQAYTLLDGPRTDVNDHTTIWHDRWGAPRRIRDAMGAETLLVRGDTRFPALVTHVRASDREGRMELRDSAAYDARGRVTRAVVVNPLGDGRDRVTSYAYDDRWDAVRYVDGPGSEPVTMAYDTLGNRVWQQVGDASRRVRYRYYEGTATNAQWGMLRAIEYPAVGAQPAVDSLAYDRVGNLAATRTPMGFYTLFYKDELGRDTLVISPIHAATSTDSASVAATGLRQRTRYDVMNRVWYTATIGPAVTFSGRTLSTVRGAGGDSVSVRNTYDRGGLLLKVERWTTPDTARVGVLTSEYRYDWAGRKIAQLENNDGWEYFRYDAAGNMTEWETRRLDVIRTEYDALGRQTRRIVPPATYLRDRADCTDLGGEQCTFTFPIRTASNYEVPADTSYFEYDLAGNLRRAENHDAIVARTYYPGGALATDSLRLRAVSQGRFDLHEYEIRYGYDRAGRMQWLEHPEALAGPMSRDSFYYEPVTGALARVRSRTGAVFGYEYDVQGRLRTESYPGGANTLHYDLEGRRVARSGAYQDSMVYDARGKVVQARVYQGVVTDHLNYYSGIGNLVGMDVNNFGINTAMNAEDVVTDGLGHMVYRRVDKNLNNAYPVYRYRYEPGSSRLALTWNDVPQYDEHGNRIINDSRFDYDSTARAYDQAGNVEMGREHGWNSGYRKIQGRSYYSADNRLRSQHTYHELSPYFDGKFGEGRGAVVDYRYDALGRRVLVRTRRDGVCRTGQSSVDCTGGIERFVWAGDNILWEMRGPGADSVQGARLDEPTAPGVEFGAVGYTYAGGVDQPLVMWKGSEVVIPHLNWRGLFGKGTTMSGSLSTAQIEWPGFNTGAYHNRTRSQATYRAWYGSVLEGKHDAGGTMYMRNRYYDPATGQFTQTDPIGVAGGLNTYGFGAGDPVTYSDPYGLFRCPGSPGCPLPGTHPGTAQLGRPGWLDRKYDEWRRNFTEAPAAQVLRASVAFVRNYANMREANTHGADKYFHCKANCEAAQAGAAGAGTAEALSNIREGSDFVKETATDTFTVEEAQQHSAEDQASNRRGRAGGRQNPNGDCRRVCHTDRPNGLPERH